MSPEKVKAEYVEDPDGIIFDDVDLCFRDKQRNLSAPASEYVEPQFPFQLPEAGPSFPAFGKPMKQEHFALDPKWVYVQHGSYGAALRCALDTQQRWRDVLELQPRVFYHTHLLPHLVYATRQLADFVGVGDQAEHVSFVANASTGTATVLRSVLGGGWEEGDRVLTLSVGYPAVLKAVFQLAGEHGRKLIHIVQVDVDLGNEGILAAVKGALDTPGVHFRLAVFDHITSGTALVLPVRELVELCRSRGVPVHIDGAHAIGQVALDLRALGEPDYYVSNMHKWLCTPRGCAFVYSHPRAKRLLPLVPSHGIEQGQWSSLAWMGTLDPTAYLSVVSALDFFRSLGPEKVYAYCHQLVVWAGNMLAQRWQTKVLARTEQQMASMALVQLPAHSVACSPQGCKLVHDAMAARKLETMIVLVKGSMWIRISAHMYNDEEDFETLATTMLEVLQELSSNEASG